MFVESLDVDDVIAHLLVTEGFSSVEEVAFVPVNDLTEIGGFNDEVTNELRERARSFLAIRDEELNQRRKELEVADDLTEVEGLTPQLVVVLGENGVKTRDNLADLASEELLEILEPGIMTLTKANAVIMAARAHWFEDDVPEDATTEEAADEGAEKAASETTEPAKPTAEADAADEPDDAEKTNES